MNRCVRWAKGWQFARMVAVPVEARTWAKKVLARTCPQRLTKFSSDHAGAMSRYTPGSARSPYQPMPKPSPLVSVFPSSACSD